MKILFLCLGSRGDVQPYVAIGKAAKSLGHQVTICAGKSFQSFVEQNGLNFWECSLDLMAILQTDEGKQVFEEGLKHPIKAMQYATRVINPLYKKTMIDFYEASQGQDVIIFHPKAFGAVDIAEKLGILCISMPPIPIIYPIKAFPNLAITTKNLGGFFNKLTYKLVNLGAESNNIKDINEFREQSLQLKKRKAGAYMTRRNENTLPIIYPISESLFGDVTEFKNEVFLTGFPKLEDASVLDEETEQFLLNGDKPIVITFSSMPLKNPEAFMKKIIQAIKNSKNRAIILVGNSGIHMGSEEGVLIKNYLPHDIIFSKAKGILHHGGVGTMAAALRSGVVQVMMPFNVDQPFWANRLYGLGYALKPLKESDSEDEFINRFQQMSQNENKIKAKEIAEILSKEQPNLRAVKQIEELQQNWVSQHE